MTLESNFETGFYASNLIKLGLKPNGSIVNSLFMCLHFWSRVFLTFRPISEVKERT